MCYVKIPVHDIWMFMLWIVYFEQLLFAARWLHFNASGKHYPYYRTFGIWGNQLCLNSLPSQNKISNFAEK